MNLVEKIVEYLSQPIPVWNPLLTKKLVQAKWSILKEENSLSSNNFSISRAITKNPALFDSKRVPLVSSIDQVVYLEYPSKELEFFYNKHGINVMSKEALEDGVVFSKIEKALAILKRVKDVYLSVINLVESIQVVKQDYDYIDVSYSNPKLPFSVFVSVCSDSNIVSSLRVAESVLHEAMHLKLTLLEEIIVLVKSDTSNVYYSPWRDEKRPAQGVLHGLFVFRVIHDFYNEIIHELRHERDAVEFIKNRMKEIREELTKLTYFSNIPELSKEGKKFVLNLLK
jgi:hypothetical protein